MSILKKNAIFKLSSLCILSSSFFPAFTYALSDVCKQQVNNTIEKLENCITKKGLIGHLQAFQTHADASKNIPHTRFTGSDGDTASKHYVINTLLAAGYKVSVQDVPIEYTYVNKASLEQKIPQDKTYQRDLDYIPFVGSGSNNLVANVEMPNGNADGCQKSDFSGFHAGNIALIQRGGLCWPNIKVANAVAAGAVAVMIYNDVPGEMLYPALNGKPPINTPVLFITTEIADEIKTNIANNIPTSFAINFKAINKKIFAQNIFAESLTGNPGRVVMVGAHLDSALISPGMNDNASSAATVLETALALKNVKLVNKLRFAWWTGEELGLVGSDYYVAHLSRKEKANIAVYLNYEILGAPNGARFIMGVADGVTAPGSEKITQRYVDYFKSQNLKYFVIDPTFANAAERSDMRAFNAANIPSGFIATGAELTWNPLFAAIFTDLPDRVLGRSTHPCYHKLCDKLTLDVKTMTDPNFDFDLYLQMSKAAAYAIFSYAMEGEQLA